ncbi:RRXRR domain-containing protein [Crocosphaera sp.]|uniref:RRXRR domain-containing protein n=1 Tax=Crocosphaera sp. TaxID=2729996 RepID=UPI0026329C3F|nr:RRXRR domain-containing protein [Crocosphaera sp.]MDJ0582033.1 RRXRR domain-containing protein [Crocosphaera sp.]
MLRVPVLSLKGTPLMPTKPSRARRWIEDKKAVGKFNKLGQFYVQLLVEPSDTKTQSIALGIDPGKLFSGIGVQSTKFTLFTAHLELPFKKVRERMDNRRMMRRGRRGRRINRQLPFQLRAHRQKRFNNRKQGKLSPSIKANRQLELRVIQELCKVFPVSDIYFEYVKADVDLTSGRKGAKSGKGFSAVMVGQKWMLKQLEKLGNVHTIYGWQTSNLRKHLKLEKSRNKAEQTPSSHAVDGVTLACYQFLNYQAHYSGNNHGHTWQGIVAITPCQFMLIKRPPISRRRRQLHLMLPSKGGKRRKYGGTITRHGIRKGDFVKGRKAGKVYYGWCSGDTAKQVSVSDFYWKRLGQFTASKVVLLQRSTGLLYKQGTDFVGATVC